jgi:hypothetical protein
MQGEVGIRTKVLVLERVECSPFTLKSAMIFQGRMQWTHVDGHALLGGKSNFRHLWDILGSLHVGSITSSTEDNGNLGVWIDIVGSDQSTGSIVDERSQLGWDLESLEGSHKHGSDVSAFNVGCAETFGPSDQFSVVNPVLGTWVGELSSGSAV